MKARISLMLLVFVCAGAASLLFAQEPSQAGATQTTTAQGATVVMPASLDNQGIKNYVLGPGDTLDVRVFGQPDFNTMADVDGDGNISLPFVEKPIVARCRSERDIQKDISAAYSKYLKNPQVSVRIVGRNSRPPAIVHGAVVMPQRVQMQRQIRLNDLLAYAGGITERSNGMVQVLHTEPVMCPAPGEIEEPETTVTMSDGVKLQSFKVYRFSDIVAGKEDANPIVRPGDIVKALEAEPVYITGSVVSPQGVYLHERQTLTGVLAQVGGVRKEAKSNDIRIYRQKQPGSVDRELIVADLTAIKKKQKEDVVLKPYDIIEVPEASKFSKSRVLDTFATSVLGGFSSAISATGGMLPLRVLY
ncbi:MAG TPA: polysaccharide biosynthesis/export family protein [Pyrinomonadaceae bacterium]|jgi:polysaccharide export outer membrane protein|nr:polysaccharide biosynthesis/export family protein [Pyrinomonadaceae bacterium]